MYVTVCCFILSIIKYNYFYSAYDLTTKETQLSALDVCNVRLFMQRGKSIKTLDSKVAGVAFSFLKVVALRSFQWEEIKQKKKFHLLRSKNYKFIEIH